MESNYDFTFLYPSHIKTDEKYQRKIDSKRVAKIVKDWDDNLVNAPKVSLRHDGKYYVFNGQHTLAAWQKKYGDKPIQCKVFRGLSEEEEKNLFVRQEGYSRPVGNYDKIRAEYNSGSSDVVDMAECCKVCGLSIDFNTNRYEARFKVNALVTAYNVYKSIGHDNFINALTVLRNSFYGDPEALQDNFLKGIGYLFKHHADKIHVNDMINSLQKQPVGYYKQLANTLEGSAAVRYAKSFVSQYNKHRRSNRIEIK